MGCLGETGSLTAFQGAHSALEALALAHASGSWAQSKPPHFGRDGIRKEKSNRGNHFSGKGKDFSGRAEEKIGQTKEKIGLGKEKISRAEDFSGLFHLPPCLKNLPPGKSEDEIG